MKRIGVLTSGGDAPGMNAAIRAATRYALDQGCEVYGVHHGYTGLCHDSMAQLTARDVGGIMQEGGTALGSARCEEFKTEAGRRKALRTLHERGLEGVVVIGGDGSQTGASRLSEMGFPVVGVASTIDNDLYGVDISIGVDTALDVALEAIDRLKVTASSHHRAFVIEVMGRDSGYLALMSALAGGVDCAMIPELEADPEEIAAKLRDAYDRGKAHAMVVVAEGARYDGQGLVHYFEEHQARLGFDLRLTTLGYVQRGGRPGAFDRLLATRCGTAAVDCLIRGEHGVLVGLRGGAIGPMPLLDVVAKKRELDLSLLEMVGVLAR